MSTLGTNNFKLADKVSVTGPQPRNGFFGRGTTSFSIQGTVQGTGAVSALIQLEVSNDELAWIAPSAAQINLNGTDSASDFLLIGLPYTFVRANVVSISGTDAKVSVTVGG